ncbi:MAG: hypothetical protein N2327_02030 [Caldimicrobium sp.]|nr:hypothetical protein [Caldimicrobium sp.]
MRDALESLSWKLIINFVIYPEMFRAIEVCTDLTERKKGSYKRCLSSYRETAKEITSYQWQLFFRRALLTGWLR